VTRQTLCRLIIAAFSTTSCATNLDRSDDRRRVVIENASPDVIRVFIDLGGTNRVLLGRLEPTTVAALPMRPPLIDLAGDVEIVVVTTALPRRIREYYRAADLEARSGPYPIEALVRHAWRYTGKRIEMVLFPDHRGLESLNGDDQR
jgi:hypothetical protein